MLPLEGMRILVTRESQQAKPFTDMITQRGGISIEIPLLVFQRSNDLTTKRKLEQVYDYEWIVFTSSNGIHHFFDWLEELEIDQSYLSQKRFAVVGDKTAQSLLEYGFLADFVPDIYTGKQLGESFAETTNDKTSLLVVQGNLSKQTAAQELKEQGHRVETVTVYETHVNVKIKDGLQEELLSHSLDILTFTSPSTVRAFCSLGEGAITEDTLSKPCLCIGSTTEQEAKSYGFSHVVVPHTFSIEGMIEALEAYQKRHKEG
ncbi:uroporphyrinogen-III synthase [Pontibacillus marinus]|uniref:Uroporphyrinogen-III synthase n=1 Tax=Pontibacillus marinus BH030004 = DSM 16465 TaxID=1385511 RepID=A0A0A5HWT9_9BACI|nr:uroporphyrinogen-III synthase [Pontibacillus marinus]KGX88087.1 hypothetical protein N783_08910 [Pontibacillus marinus BH030004 = DSM 16465]